MVDNVRGGVGLFLGLTLGASLAVVVGDDAHEGGENHES